MRVYITGVAGFIGSHIAERMVAAGHEVRGVDNLLTGREDNVPDGVLWRDEDITVNAGWSNEISRWAPEVVYHCAASYDDRSNWERDADTNVIGTIEVVRAALSVNARLVYFQTSLCYGLNPGPDPLTVDAPLNPQGSYAVSKTAGERYIHDSGVDYVSLRLANVYGPRNLSGPVPAFFKRLTAGEPCTVVDSRRDFLFIDDLLGVAIPAAEQGSGVYHVASGRDAPIHAIYANVRAALGLDQPYLTETVPRPADDAPSILLDPSATEVEFGWKADTRLSDGVNAAVEWYREHGVERTYTHLSVQG